MNVHGPGSWKVTAGHRARQSEKSATEQEIFETIKATSAFALEPELHAMVRQLRSGLPTVPEAERAALIDDIERLIGTTIEEELEY